MKFAVLAVIGIVVAGPAMAQTNWPREWCEKDRAMLSAYMTGALDFSYAIRALDKEVGREIAPTFCIPKQAKIGEIAEAFCQYISTHKDRLTWPPGLLMHSAMHENFPCQ